MGLSEGFLGSYWMFPVAPTADGYNTDGVDPTFRDIPTTTIDFNDTTFKAVATGM